MAREAILRDTDAKTHRRYTWTSGNGVAKGAFLKGIDPHTASHAITTNDFFIGFAHADVNMSTDSNFNTEVSVTADKGGVYELTASGAITVGSFVKVAAPGNYVMACDNTDMTASMSRVVGIALETASNGEQINVEVFP